MKKIWLFLVVSFCFICSTYAASIDYVNTGYYFKVGSDVKEVKKYFVRGRDHMVLFKNSYQDAAYSNYDYSVYSFAEENDLATIIYYGYNKDKTLENYYYTQMYIWKKYYNLEVAMCDKEGHEVENEEEIYNNLQEIIDKHNQKEDFLTSPVRREIWTTSDFNFYNDLEMDVSESPLNIEKNRTGITIHNDTVGEYTFDVSSNYIPHISRYYKDPEYYFLSTQGPSLKEGTVHYEIYGTPFKVEEEIVGLNGKIGDIKYLNNSYSLYLNNEYKLNVLPNKEEYVKSEENYILSGGYNPYLEDLNNLSFYVDSIDNYVLTIKRHVKTQKINLNIKDNNTYYIYLKSNDDLYYVVNKDIKEVFLPFGEYYLKNLNGDYNVPLKVTLEGEINLDINNPVKTVTSSSLKEETLKEDAKVEKAEAEKEAEEKEKEILENKEEEINKEEGEEEFSNPQTLDNIPIYFLTFFLSLASLSYIGYLVVCKHMSNHVNLTK